MKNKNLTIGLGVALVAIVAGVAFYVNQNDAPPRLSLGGEGVQGMLTGGKQGFLQYQERDKDAYREFVSEYKDEHNNVEKFELNKGVNYVYVERDTTVDDLRRCIDPKAEMVLFAQYDAEEKQFMVYPEGPFEETKEVDEDYEFEKGEGLVIIAKEKADTYCVVDPAEKSDLDITAPLDEDVKGWVLLAVNEDNIESFIAPFKNRVDKVWALTDDTEFEKVKESDYDEDFEDFYLVWLKLDKGENNVVAEDGVEPKNLRFEVDMEARENRLIWDVSPDTYDEKDLTGYMFSIRKEDQEPKDAVTRYLTGDDYIVSGGEVTLLLGEIFPGDVYIVKVGAVYDGDKEGAYYSDEFTVAVADDGEPVEQADLNVVPANVHIDLDNEDEAVDINGDGRINFLDVFVGVSWTRVASEPGRAVTGYTVKLQVCDNAGGVGQNCEDRDPILVEGENSFKVAIEEDIEFGKVYKVAVAANITERNGDLKYSDYVQTVLPAIDELTANDFADIFKDLSVPKNFRVTQLQDGAVTLAWDSVTGAGADRIPGYEVLYTEFSESADLKDEEDRTVEVFGRVNQATIDGLDKNKQYMFVVKVKGFDYDGEYFSNYLFVVPKAGHDGFIAPEIGEVSALADGTVSVRWGTPGLNQDYEVKGFFVLARAGDGGFAEGSQAEAGDRNIVIDDLDPGVEYAFAVLAVYEVDGKTVVSNYSEWKEVATLTP